MPDVTNLQQRAKVLLEQVSRLQEEMPCAKKMRHAQLQMIEHFTETAIHSVSCVRQALQKEQE